MTAPAPKLAYSVKEAAAAVGVSEDTIQREIKAERLAAKRLGRRILITGAELMAWLETQDDANA